MKYMSRDSVRHVVLGASVPLALLISAASASAQYGKRLPQGNGVGRNGGQQELFEWQGRVDKEIRIQMNSGRASVQQVGNNERTNNRVRAVMPVPREDGIVTVQQIEGRGKVDVVQQPTRDNGYTAIVRLRDPDSGAATYRIAAYWQPTGNSGYGNRRHGNRNNGAYDNAGYGSGRNTSRW
jgi:hypothetical protein